MVYQLSSELMHSLEHQVPLGILIQKKQQANRDNPMSIAPISAAAWPDILKIQDEVYTGVAPETLEVLKSKWQASPQTCFVFQLPNNHMTGYLLAHPWDALEPPKLFESHDPSSSGQGLYLHDLAVSKHSRGLGVGKQLASTLLKAAKALRFKRVLLVVVQGSQGFWSSLGFTEIADGKVCASYGDDASLMLINL